VDTVYSQCLQSYVVFGRLKKMGIFIGRRPIHLSAPGQYPASAVEDGPNIRQKGDRIKGHRWAQQLSKEGWLPYESASRWSRSAWMSPWEIPIPHAACPVAQSSGPVHQGGNYDMPVTWAVSGTVNHVEVGVGWFTEYLVIQRPPAGRLFPSP
jgi:hypothetical protein